jgi:DNA-binding NarL/FixJ family response regulator
MAEIKIVVVEDHEIFRDGLRALIESRPGYRVVAESDRERDARAVIARVAFDLLITDLSLPGTSGMALVREMRRLRRPEPILLLTMHVSADVAAEALRAGANGYALKCDSRPMLLEAIERVVAGGRYISPSLPSDAVDSFLQRRRGGITSAMDLLSAREREIFDLFVRGYDNETAATELSISTKTVETHRGHIFSKLRVHSMSDLVRFAFRHQLLRAGDVPPETMETVRKGA